MYKKILENLYFYILILEYNILFYAAARQTVIDFFDDYYKIVSKAKLI